MAAISKKRLEAFRRQLSSLQVEITTLLGQTRGDSKPVDLDLPIGRLTRADAMQMQGMAALNKRQLEIRLKQVEGALSAVEDGSFGSCRYCKGEIQKERLEAHPETPFCVGCQEMFEQER